jgi:hypothetical protein
MLEESKMLLKKCETTFTMKITTQQARSDFRFLNFFQEDRYGPDSEGRGKVVPVLNKAARARKTLSWPWRYTKENEWHLAPVDLHARTNLWLAFLLGKNPA